MTYVVVHHFPGGTQEQYEAALAVVHPTPDTLPAGQVQHLAGPTADGWMIVAIHEDQASWEAFRDETLVPHMSGGLDGSFTGPPSETTFEAASEISA